MDQVKFTRMQDGDREDYDFLTRHETAHTKGTAGRLLAAMVDLDAGLSGYRITRLGHCLQSATRVWRAGADDDWVVSALLHDIGDIYAPYNHDEYAAAILRPFVREQCAWVVEKHGDFQLKYYGAHVGANPDKRDTYAGHPFYDDCAEFCAQWDQTSFDPAYDTLPLVFFAPMVQRIFDRTPYDPDVIRTGKRTPLTDSQLENQRRG